MGKRGLGGWLRRRMARRLEKKLDLDEQSMKLIDFAGGLNPLQQQRAIAILAKPRHSCRTV